MLKTWFFLHETWHTTLFCIYYGVEVIGIENHRHMLQNTSYVAILWVFKNFWHFNHYCVEVVRIKNNRHKLEITSYVAI